MQFNRKTILLVEDEAIIAENEKRQLQDEGYNVVHEFSGEKAVEAVNKGDVSFDLILMDIDLGRNKMDGTEAARLILVEHDIPLLFLSSHTEKEIVERTEEITSYGYVVKGSTSTVLMASLKMAFKLHKANADLKHSISEREKAEEKLLTLNRKLRAISACNSTLIHSENEQALLKEVCRTICEIAGYHMAWVGYAEHDEECSVRPMAYAGNEEGYLSIAKISWADTVYGRGPTGTTIRTGRISYIQDFTKAPALSPWLELAVQRNYRSSIALPLKYTNGKPFGALTIYSNVTDSFTPEEISLLEELANDLGYGIIALRTQNELKETDQELSKSQTLIKSLVDSTMDIIWSVDPVNFGVVIFNKSLKEYFSRLGIEIKAGMRPEDIFPDEEYIAQWKAFYRRALNEKSFKEEYVVYLKDRTLLLQFNLMEKDGEAFGISIFGKDITELKQANAAIKENEEKLRALFECTLDAIGVSSNGQHVFSNPAYRKLFGYDTESELIGTPIINCIAESERERVLALVKARSSDQPAPTFYVTRGRRKNGTEFDIEINVATYKLNDKVFTVGNIHDITERKLIESALEFVARYVWSSQKDNFFSSLAAYLGSALKMDYVFICRLNDDAGPVSYYTSDVGLENKSLIRESVKLAEVFSSDITIIENEVTKKLPEIDFLFSIGAESLAGIPLMNSYNHIIGFIALSSKKPLENISVVKSILQIVAVRCSGEMDRRLHEDEIMRLNAELEKRVIERTKQLRIVNDELAEANRKLEIEFFKQKEAEEIVQQALIKEKELNELKSKFISITSHEFRTPLTSIFSSIEILEMSGPDYEEAKRTKHFSKLRKNIDYLITMIDELLYLNKIDSGRIELSYEKTNISEFCRDIFEEIRIFYPDITPVIELSPLLAESIIEKNIMRKILGNLITNAFKYNKPKGKVIFKVAPDSTNLVFSVSDTGIGIPADERKNMFEPFSRMSNGKHIKGTGLGLSIVKKSVERLNGSISFESRINKGTTFTIKIPVQSKSDL